MSDYTPEQYERAAEKAEGIRSPFAGLWRDACRAYAATLRQQGAKVSEAQATLDAVCGVFGIGSEARTRDVIVANAKNASRRSACLSAIEREFTTEVPDEDDGEGDTIEDCPLSWGASPEKYIQQFRAALAQNKQGEAVAVDPASWPSACAWPAKPFTVRDEPGEHDPCWLVLPDNAMLAFVHHAANGVDQARAQFIADACNAYTHAERATVPEGMVLVPREPTQLMVVDGFECDAWDALGDAVLEKKGWPYSCRESAECVTAIYKAMIAGAEVRS